jgi:hypothetical protein
VANAPVDRRTLYNLGDSEYNAIKSKPSVVLHTEKDGNEFGSGNDPNDARDARYHDALLHLLARLSSLCQELLTPAQIALSRAAGAAFCLVSGGSVVQSESWE